MVLELGIDDNFQPIVDSWDDGATVILSRVADGQLLTANHLVNGFAYESYCHAHHMVEVLLCGCYHSLRGCHEDGPIEAGEFRKRLLRLIKTAALVAFWVE